jgi:hypothetical protein
MSKKIAKQQDATNTLEFYLESRNAKKRTYIYDYGKSRKCDHPSLKVVARGGIVYRCLECNYAFHITGSYQQPLHHEVIQGAFTMLTFAKEFGMDSLGEVLRRPIGQSDKSPHKPVLPEGMSFADVLYALEEVDVENTEDGGAKQLSALFDQLWVSDEERAKRRKALEGVDPHRRTQVPGVTDRKELEAGDTDATEVVEG